MIKTEVIQSHFCSEDWSKIQSFIWAKNPTTVSYKDVLAIVRVSSLLNIQCKFSDILNIADSLQTENSMVDSILRMSIVECISYESIGRMREVSTVHPWFSQNYQKYIPNSQIAEPYSINRKRPDFIVSINEVHYPVECKLTFGVDGLRKLKMYMKLWRVNKGFAVGKRSTVEFPPNIEFIKANIN